MTDEERSSDTKFFRSLADAIEKGNVTLINNDKENTHWTHWVEKDFNDD
ncbi:DUF7003 family protein [Priestia endophytica]